MKTKAMLASVLAAVLLIACAETPIAGDEEGIVIGAPEWREIAERAERALNERDGAHAERLFAENAVWVTVTGDEIRGREAIARRIEQQRGQFSFEILDEEHTEDVAIAYGRWRWTPDEVEDGDEAEIEDGVETPAEVDRQHPIFPNAEMSGRYLTVLKHTGARWQIRHSMSSVDPEARQRIPDD